MDNLSNQENIDYINQRINESQPVPPKYLYKYRPFDKYAFDMLENKYLYMCPAENLDDPSECKADIGLDDIYNWQTNQLKIQCIRLILDQVRPYTTEENFYQAKQIISHVLMRDGTIRTHFLLDCLPELQEYLPPDIVAPLVNWLTNIPQRLSEPEIANQIEELVSLAYSARKGMGICSFSILNNSYKMWELYADHSS